LRLDPIAEAKWHADASRERKRLEEIYGELKAQPHEAMTQGKIEAIELYQQIDVFHRPHTFDAQGSSQPSVGQARVV